MSVSVALASNTKKAPTKTKMTKTPADHPSYAEMIGTAIKALKERTGSSRQAILKYILANYKVGDQAPSRLKIALRKLSESGKIVHTKGQGASGSFKLPKLEPKPKVEKKEKKPLKETAAQKKASKKPTEKKQVAKNKAEKDTTKKPAGKNKATKKPAAKDKATKKPAVKNNAPKKTAAKEKTQKKTPKKPTAKKPVPKKYSGKKSA